MEQPKHSGWGWACQFAGEKLAVFMELTLTREQELKKPGFQGSDPSHEQQVQEKESLGLGPSWSAEALPSQACEQLRGYAAIK